MMALGLVLILALVFAAVWSYLSRRAEPAPEPTVRGDAPTGEESVAPAAVPEATLEMATELMPEPLTRRKTDGHARRGDPRLEVAEEHEWSALHEQTPLPAHYGSDVTVALVRNPRSLYVYWERGGNAESALRAAVGEAAWRGSVPCIRIFDLTGAEPGGWGPPSVTIDVGEHDDHWFIHQGIEPGHRYAVTYERRTRDGRYFLLSRSHPVQMPHDGPVPGQAAGTEGAGLLAKLYARRPEEINGSPWR
jgi:hypothetical protein